VDPSLRLGLELRPLVLPAPGAEGTGATTGSLERLVAEVGAAEQAGFGAVWLHGGAGTVQPTADACTLAGALASATSTITLGVVAVLPGGRLPSVMAREVTGLDRVSHGRSAVLFEAPLAGPEDPLETADALCEAGHVCRAVLTEASPTFEGRQYRVHDAVNLPPPLRAGGPPVVVGLPRTDAVPTRCLVDAVAASGDPTEARHLRRWLDEAEPGGSDHRVALLWRTGPDGTGAPLDELVSTLGEAGVDGFLWSGPDDPERGVEDVAAAGAALVSAVAGWWA